LFIFADFLDFSEQIMFKISLTLGGSSKIEFCTRLRKYLKQFKAGDSGIFLSRVLPTLKKYSLKV